MEAQKTKIAPGLGGGRPAMKEMAFVGKRGRQTDRRTQARKSKLFQEK